MYLKIRICFESKLVTEKMTTQFFKRYFTAYRCPLVVNGLKHKLCVWFSDVVMVSFSISRSHALYTHWETLSGVSGAEQRKQTSWFWKSAGVSVCTRVVVTTVRDGIIPSIKRHIPCPSGMYYVKQFERRRSLMVNKWTVLYTCFETGAPAPTI